MPQLSDLVEKRKFVKKEYRPWDLSGTGTVDGKDKPTETLQSETTPVVNINNLESEEKVAIIEQINVETPVSQGKIDNKTGNVSDNKRVTIEEQRDNNKITSVKQRDNIKVTIREHTDNTKDNITDNTPDLAYLIDSIKKLAGIQKCIFLYVINVCSARGSLDTGNILTNDLALTANCSIGSAKTSLIRLLEKHLVLRLPGKASRGGHMVLGITKEIQAAAIQAQQALFNPLKLSQTDNITGNVTNNINSYSSSIYKNNITTTSLPDEWRKIDFESLIKIGFSETQLRQLYQAGVTDPNIVQESLNHFSFGLDNNPKFKSYSDPLNVLMGVLRKGGSWIEKSYVSPKELALIQLLEQKKREAENINLLENQILEEDYKIWLRKLTDELKDEILSKAPKSSMLSKTLTDKTNEAFLLQHFKLNVYGK